MTPEMGHTRLRAWAEYEWIDWDKCLGCVIARGFNDGDIPAPVWVLVRFPSVSRRAIDAANSYAARWSGRMTRGRAP